MPGLLRPHFDDRASVDLDGDISLADSVLDRILDGY